jgi:hypothetical protein
VTQIGNRGQLVIVRRLSEAVQRIASIALRAMGHVLQMAEGHDLRLLDAVNVDIGADAIFHAAGGQIGLDRRDGLGGDHERRSFYAEFLLQHSRIRGQDMIT